MWKEQSDLESVYRDMIMLQRIRCVTVIIVVYYTAIACSLSEKVPGNSTNDLSFVDGGSLISIYGKIAIPNQLKMDFLESTLYAQINASLRYDRQVDGFNWYSSYIAILQHIGWNVSMSKFEVVNESGIFNWKRSIETILGQHLSQSEITFLDSTITSFCISQLLMVVCNYSTK